MGAMLQTSTTLRESITSVITDCLPAREWEQRIRRGRRRRHGQDHSRLDGVCDVRGSQVASGEGTGRHPDRRTDQAGARHSRSTGRHDHRRRRRGAQLLREQLSRPGRRSAPGRGGQAGDRRVGLWSGQRALHLRHPGTAPGIGAAHLRIPGHRGHDSVFVVLRRQRWCLRDPVRRARTRSSPTRSTTHPSSTASGCPRRAGCATATGTWPIWRCSCGRPRDARFRVIVTDGVFSMDGYIAPLAEICELADRYDALVFVDDSHAVGFIGEHGRGTPELCGVQGRVDIYTGTFGKALGGASGGYVGGASRDRRPAAPAVPALPVLQHPGAGDRGRHPGRASTC